MNADDAIVSLADVQRLLLPDNPRIRGLDYAVHYQPAAIAAGDYYDLMPLNHRIDAGETAPEHLDVWGMMIADVSGHGPAAAMEAVQFDAILRTYRGDEAPGGPAGALTYANRHFFSRRPRPHFMTAFACLYRPDLQRLTFVSAGHPPLLLRRADAVVAIGESGDIPLGIERDYIFSNSEVEVQPGDILLAYTDGIPDARDPHRRALGFERLVELFSTARGDAAAVLGTLVEALHAHQGGALGEDDQTLLVLQPLA